MPKSQLPPAFTAYLGDCFQSGRFTNVKRFYQCIILRWTLWSDGHTANAMPGYQSCPDADPATGVPAGWTYQKFRKIALSASGIEGPRKKPAPRIDMEKVTAAASAASSYRFTAKPHVSSLPPVDAARRKPLSQLHKGCSGFGRRDLYQQH